MAAMRLDMQGVVAQEQQQIGGAIFCASAVCGDENPKGNVAIISADTNQATTRSGPYELALEWKTNPKDPEDGWPVAELSAHLLELELSGAIARLPGQQFQRRAGA